MLLFVNQSDNILTSQKAGLLATIHNANDTVIPNDMGFTVPVGYSIAVGVRRIAVTRLGAPYGECVVTPDPKEYFYKTSYSVEVIDILLTFADPKRKSSLRRDVGIAARKD